ncbi:MAG TPA: BON domain-containing protein [Candidatus Kapabacteria bacterium]|nr:BON domain-containing protein [Candidatus Kapabacteria bacterium]
MNRIVRFLAPMALALTLVACTGDADVDVDNDSVGVDADVDVAPDTVGTNTGMVDTTAVTVDGEGIEKLVEAKLIAAPGYGDVDVESGGEGVIILNGTVATDAEKTEAERLAREVDGVTTVTNNITLKP